MRVLLISAGILAATQATATQPGYAAHYDNMLGTSLDVQVVGVKADQAEPVIRQMLDEIQRLEQILSTWQPNSQVSRLNRAGQAKGLADELITVTTLCEQWHTSSHHAFSCRMGKINRRWQQARQQQVVPDRVDMRYQARDIDRQPLEVDSANHSVNLGDLIELDPSGLAKGFIIDRASHFVRQHLAQIQGLKLDIGGDAFYWGKTENNTNWHVAIATPDTVNDDISANNPLSVKLSSKAIAASGHNSRFFEIQNRRFSHILSPQDGWPMDSAPSAVVIADNTTTADAVATALSTLPAMQGLDWVNSLDGVEALIMLADGTNISSDHWGQYLLLGHQQTASTQLPTLHIDYQIPDIQALEYHKPYVALWITDNHNKPIKNLLLLGENSRWARENTRWWRKVGRRNPDLLDGLARPTRRPGQYNLLWNGLDDAGHPLSGSEYQLHIEAAREEGGHDYQSINFNLDNATLDLNLPAQGELGEVALHLIR